VALGDETVGMTGGDGRTLTEAGVALGAACAVLGVVSEALGVVSEALGVVSEALGVVSEAFGVVSEAFGVVSEAFGVVSEAPGVSGRMLGGGGRGPVDGGAGVSRGFGRAGGGGGCWLGRDNGARLRFGGGGAPEGRDGSTLEPPLGRGGSDTGRGGCAPDLGGATVGSLPITARFSLSLAVPCSSPMEASAPDPLSIAQIALKLLAGS